MTFGVVLNRIKLLNKVGNSCDSFQQTRLRSSFLPQAETCFSELQSKAKYNSMRIRISKKVMVFRLNGVVIQSARHYVRVIGLPQLPNEVGSFPPTLFDIASLTSLVR